MSGSRNSDEFKASSTDDAFNRAIDDLLSRGMVTLPSASDKDWDEAQPLSAYEEASLDAMSKLNQEAIERRHEEGMKRHWHKGMSERERAERAIPQRAAVLNNKQPTMHSKLDTEEMERGVEEFGRINWHNVPDHTLTLKLIDVAVEICRVHVASSHLATEARNFLTAMWKANMPLTEAPLPGEMHTRNYDPPHFSSKGDEQPKQD